MRLADLFEDVRPDVLYHAVRWMGDVVPILSDNELKALTLQRRTRTVKKSMKTFKDQFRDHEVNHPAGAFKDERVPGVSLTRSKEVAKKWGIGRGAVLVLDAVKLRQTHRVVPYSWLDYTRHEAEEFVVGPIRNLDRYLIGIYTKRDSKDDIPDEVFHHPLYKGEF